ncbi:MAG: protease HtpX [Chlamydiae bacterium]|nr:protease HtpX [Chlamydiota bacterium]
MFKRIFLFIAMNALVITTISIVLSVLNVRPYLNAYGVDYVSLLIFCGVWGITGAFISLLLSKQMAKWMMHIEIVSSHDKLYKMVEELSRKAGLSHVPEVGIFTSQDMNAFATGPTQKHSLVAVSTALLHKMPEDELRAVLGHEVAHIANGDMVTMTLLQGVVNAFVMFLARVLAFAFSGLGKDRDSRSGSYLSFSIFTMLFEVVFMILGAIVIASFSRYREFKADKGSADLIGKRAMIAALERLGKQRESIQEVKAESLRAMMISQPGKRGLLSLFATHPPIEERIAHLERGY